MVLLLTEPGQIADVPAVGASGDGADADVQVQEPGLRDSDVETEARVGSRQTQRPTTADDHRVSEVHVAAVVADGPARRHRACWRAAWRSG